MKQLLLLLMMCATTPLLSADGNEQTKPFSILDYAKQNNLGTTLIGQARQVEFIASRQHYNTPLDKLKTQKALIEAYKFPSNPLITQLDKEIKKLKK